MPRRRRRKRRSALAVSLGLIALAIAILAAMSRLRPQDVPWTRLDLAEPVGAFTGRKLARLTEDYPECRRLLTRAGVRFEELAPVTAGRCSYDDVVRLTPSGPRRITFSPRDVGMACPVAAALAMWEWNVLQPVAQRHFGSEVASIEHFGAYNCRRQYGRRTGSWSEHATANALDVAGFRLADGTRITVARDWQGTGAKSRFLHEVRDGACGLYATVLSPDYNAAHRDHLHLDQAARGALGWRACR